MILDNCLGDATTAEPGTGVIEEVAADKGYQDDEVLKACADLEIRTYSPELEGDDRKWDDKEAGMKEAFHGNRQRMKRSKGKTLQQRRSELVGRGFAHICENKYRSLVKCFHTHSLNSEVSINTDFMRPRILSHSVGHGDVSLA